jgi:hypothetical protein
LPESPVAGTQATLDLCRERRDELACSYVWLRPRIRVAPTVLDAGPITCGAGDKPFATVT